MVQKNTWYFQRGFFIHDSQYKVSSLSTEPRAGVTLSVQLERSLRVHSRFCNSENNSTYLSNLQWNIFICPARVPSLSLCYMTWMLPTNGCWWGPGQPTVCLDFFMFGRPMNRCAPAAWLSPWTPVGFGLYPFLKAGGYFTRCHLWAGSGRVHVRAESTDRGCMH